MRYFCEVVGVGNHVCIQVKSAVRSLDLIYGDRNRCSPLTNDYSVAILQYGIGLAAKNPVEYSPPLESEVR